MSEKGKILEEMEGLTEEQMKEILGGEEIDDLEKRLLEEINEEEVKEEKVEEKVEEKTLEKGGDRDERQEERMQERERQKEVRLEEEADDEPTVEDIIARDPVLRQLSVMSEEERIVWAQANGAQGLAKLMQLQKLEMQAEIEALKQEARSVSLEAIIEDWVAEHQDWMSNPEIRDIAMGLDIALLQKRGVSHYSELSARELKEHLREVEERVKRIVNSVDNAGDRKEKKGTKEEEVRRAGSIGDLPAGGSGGLGNSPAELLEKVADDPMKLEALVERYGKKLDDLLSGLEN